MQRNEPLRSRIYFFIIFYHIVNILKPFSNANSNLLKVKNGNLDIVTTTNYVGEYQGTIGIAAIISAFNLSDKTILTVICRGGTLVTDGSVMPKYLANDNGCVFSGPVSGTYRMEFCVFYK